MGTSLLLRFLVKLLDARIGRYEETVAAAVAAAEDEDADDVTNVKRAALRNHSTIHIECKGWEKMHPIIRFVAKDGPNARSPHSVDKIESRVRALRRFERA